MVRRPPGAGTVFANAAKGVWIARLTYPDGTRHEKSAPSRRAALQKLDELRAAAALPRSPLPPPRSPAPPETTAAFLDRWLADVRVTVRPNTALNYGYHLALWRDLIGAIPLAALTAPLIQQAITRLVTPLAEGGLGYAPSSVGRARTTLGTALQRAEDWELIARNPVPKRTRPPRDERPEPDALRVEDARRILAAVAGSRLELAVTLGLCYGLRAGEVCGLRWQDVTDTEIHVRGQIDRERRFVPTKTRRATRVIPLVAPVVAALKAQHTRQAAQRLRAGPRWSDSGYCLTQGDGGPFRREGLYEAWQRFQAAHGLEPVLSFHALRHGAVSLLAALGIHERVAMEVAGHASLAVHRRYQHVPPEAVAQAVGQLAEALARQ